MQLQSLLVIFFSRRCVDAEGNKLRGSMGPSASVHCSPSPLPARTGARSLNSCSRGLCAGICEYGYKTGADGCPTCECDDPCAGYPCKDGEECVRVRDAECTGELCTGYPVCKLLNIFAGQIFSCRCEPTTAPFTEKVKKQYENQQFIRSVIF